MFSFSKIISTLICRNSLM